MKINPDCLTWLIDSDPSIRWQVMKDLLKNDEKIYTQERNKIQHHGWGAELLKLQGSDGLWNKQLYNGKWISTTYTLYLLKLLGLPSLNPQALSACEKLLMEGIFQEGEIRFSRGKKIQDLGLSAFIISLSSFFGYDHSALHTMVDYLLEQQNSDGKWLPNTDSSSANYTFETTLLILESLFQYRSRYPSKQKKIKAAESQGQEYLLQHHLYLQNQVPIKKQWTIFSFPAYWFYDVLTALDYFRQATKAEDIRFQEGIKLVQQKQTKEGTWKLPRRHPGKTYFEMETVGKPSKWNTLRALRILQWWSASSLSKK